MNSDHSSETQHRHSIRFRGYDYTQAGAYFVTVCTQGRESVLSKVENGEVRLTAQGVIVNECWNEIPHHFPEADLDVFVIMPNHLHGILIIANMVEPTHALPPSDLPPLHKRPAIPASPKPKSLGIILGSFKSAAAKRINEMR